MTEWIRVAAKITNEYTLAAYAVAACLALAGVGKRDRLKGNPTLFALLVVAIVVSAALPQLSAYALRRLGQSDAYRISVSVLDPNGLSVTDAAVKLDIPANVYRIGDSVQVEVDLAHLPATKHITIFADDKTGTLHGSSPLTLDNDFKPSVTVKLIAKPGEVRGNILDSDGNPIVEATIMVIGHAESAVSKDGGFFQLDTPVPVGQSLTVLVEKPGFVSNRQQHFSGPTPITVTLYRAK